MHIYSNKNGKKFFGLSYFIWNNLYSSSPFDSWLYSSKLLNQNVSPSKLGLIS